MQGVCGRGGGGLQQDALPPAVRGGEDAEGAGIELGGVPGEAPPQAWR